MRRQLPLVAWSLALTTAVLGACGDDPVGPNDDPGTAEAPVLTTITPTSALAGSEPLVLSVEGAHFTSRSVVRIDATSLVTSFITEFELRVTLDDTWLTTAGQHSVVVWTPPPGGGYSQEFYFTTENPRPLITSLDPSSAVLRSDGLVVRIAGTGFVESSTVYGNGQQLATTVESSEVLTAEVPTDLIDQLEPLQITVSTPEPGGGVSAAVPLEITLDPAISWYLQTGIPANDILYDEDRDVLYASVSATDPNNPNTIARIQPGTGAILSTIPVGSEPGPLALSHGGRFLFVGLNGAPRVERIDLDVLTVDLAIPLGQDDYFGPFYAADLACIPGQPESVAVSRHHPEYMPGHNGVVLFDGATPRPLTTSRTSMSSRIEASNSAERIYGYNNETSGFELREILLNENGLTEGAVWTGLVEGFAGFDYDIVYDEGLIYGLGGAVIDATSGTVAGVVELKGSGPVAPDRTNDRIHYLDSDTESALTLRSYSMSTYQSTDSAALPPSSPPPWRLVRWGTDGLAYPTADGLVLLRAAFASP